jgi:flagellar M-ring protein FliF
VAKSLDPSAILTQLAESYLKLPLIQKIVFPLLIMASVSGIIYVSQWANRPDYVVLFSDLEPSDSGAVIERLKAQKISYEIRGDGRTIAISPPELVHELRISLASEGVPKGGVVGLEIFEMANLGSTTFQERVKFLRAIQGELERTITSLDAVNAARVHITQPERTVFARRGGEATASVMLRLRAGATLDQRQVKGIANLVAGSVEGLSVDKVAIVDINGNLLTTAEGEEEGSLVVEATRLEYQREIERGYVNRVEQMLSRVLGQGKVVARVTAELDFSSSEREEENFEPGGQVIRSERLVSEGMGGSQRGGIPGVVSNLGDDPSLLAPQGLGNDSASRNESLRNFEVSRSVVRSSSPRGTLSRLSVAVLVDGNYENQPSGPAGEMVPTFQPLSPEMLAQIESLVKSAVGFNSIRGDTITVENIPFQTSDTDFSSYFEQQQTYDMLFNLMYRTGPVLFLLLFFLIVVRPLVKFLITPTEAEVDLSRLLPTGIKELEQELKSERSKAQIPDVDPAVDLEKLEELMAENSRIVKENPQQAALLIRYWLNDGRM